MKKIYNNREKYEPEFIQSLVGQAKLLGFSLEEPKPKAKDKSEVAKPGKVENKLERCKEKEKKWAELKQLLKKEIEEKSRAQDKLK
jgi:hypothetical protein